MEVTEAASGVEALRLLTERHFDTIVVDYRLGDTTGIELIRAIKAREQRPLPIIMITGLGDERIAVSAVREGVHEYLSKSGLTAADVAQTVTTALRRAELERRLAEATAARELAEQSLRQSRQQFDDARQLTLLGTIALDLQSGVPTWSDEIYRMQGLEPGSCTPSQELFFQHVHEDDVEGLRLVAEQFLSSHEPFRHEHRLLGEDGTVRHVLASGRVIRDAAGALRQLVILVQDITALRAAENVASEREAQIQGLFEATPKGILFARMDGTVLRVNPAMCRFTGYSEAELGTMCWTDLVRSESGSGAEPSLRGQVHVHDAERLLRHRDGSSICVSINISPVREVSNVVTAVAVLVQDIRERRRVENLLRESERRFRSLVTGAPIGIFENDADNSCTFVNDAWTQITGWPASEALGRNGILHIHPDDRTRVLAEWERATVERRDYAVEFRFLTPEAREVWVSCQIRSTRDERDIITGYLGTILDITDRRSQQSALIAAKEAAEAATRAKTDFLAKISHEIRTPMNSVIGMTGLTLETALDAEQREFLEIANSSARSLLHLINDILDFSRVEAGALSLEQVAFDLPDCIAIAIRRLEYRAKEKGLALTMELSEGVPRWVVGDPHRLAQILSNLVGNAIKFTDRGSVVVRLNAKRVEPSRSALHFSVLDTGTGVPKDKRATIFEAFAQADDGVSRKFGGTGLGLAICTQILELMQGRLW
ncbi:MAG TPA: PAS domain S-box protein, partial [Polyangiaceae bacterium]|nr:PAS domain S-box protein [Polyangiaceae bacterium]